MTNKKDLSERDICTKYISPALERAGWDMHKQVREEVSFTDGRIYVKGNLSARGKRKRADYILYYKPNIPIAIIEAKENTYSIKSGIQQGLDYATILDLPSVFSSNGDGFYEHDRTCSNETIERELSLDQSFPHPKSYGNAISVTKALKLLKPSASPYRITFLTAHVAAHVITSKLPLIAALRLLPKISNASCSPWPPAREKPTLLSRLFIDFGSLVPKSAFCFLQIAMHLSTRPDVEIFVTSKTR